MRGNMNRIRNSSGFRVEIKCWRKHRGDFSKTLLQTQSVLLSVAESWNWQSTMPYDRSIPEGFQNNISIVHTRCLMRDSGVNSWVNWNSAISLEEKRRRRWIGHVNRMRLTFIHTRNRTTHIITSRYTFSDAPFDIRIGATVALTDWLTLDTVVVELPGEATNFSHKRIPWNLHNHGKDPYRAM